MKNMNEFQICIITLIAILILSYGSYVSAVEIIHDTQSEFITGTFYQTVLEGSDVAPEIRLETYGFFDWYFEDDDITGWTFFTKDSGNVIAEENPDGQIHLFAEYVTGETYAYAARTDIFVPNKFMIEYRIYFDSLDTSGVIDPFIEQPTGSNCRLDVTTAFAGFRMDIFTDRMVSFYREGTTGVDYPTIAYFDIITDIGQWYIIRFEVDFNDPDMAVQVFRDDGWIGELKADTRNTSSNTTIRELAYSRGSLSGVSEFHVDYVKLGREDTSYFVSGDYTSEVLEINADSLGTLSWTEIPASPYPWSNWVKYEGNPIISGPCLNENILCDIDDPLQQPILYDGKYWMSYATGGIPGYIKLAYSTDPELMIWTDYESNPILSPEPGVENYVFSPHIFKDGATYYLFYDVSLTVDGRQRNAYATASAPTGPWTKGQIIIDRGEPGEWDHYRVSEPFVFKDGDTYFLYYMGDHVCSGCNEQIGLATTTAALFPLGPEVGGLWTKHGLVLPHDPDPLGWDSGLTADPSIIKVGDTFYMRYTGSYANEHWQLGTAWATNPYGHWNRPFGPDIILGPPGSWDDDRLVRGAIHYHNGRYYSPYTGNGGSGYQGGMASADSASAENLITFETRTGDGVLWEDWRPVQNGGFILSTPGIYFQYRATLNESSRDFSPTLTSVTMNYEEVQPWDLSCEVIIMSQHVPSVDGDILFDIQVENVGLNTLGDGLFGELYPVMGDCASGTFFDFNLRKQLLMNPFAHGETFTGHYSYHITSAGGNFNHAAIAIGIGSAYDVWLCEPCDEFIFTRPWNQSTAEPNFFPKGEWSDREVFETALPTSNALGQNYPNPFNATTAIPVDIAEVGNVSLKVYNLSGQLVETLVDSYMDAGYHTIKWDASTLASGVYFYRLNIDELTKTRKLNLLK
ncbi:MAG: T9SS type A sorting domain-containing protein [candidate division Zixibacteria bacterium]|nr:T9SS type A sorting domain-containing protein [candidate division Zixibacteria bacterium]